MQHEQELLLPDLVITKKDAYGLLLLIENLSDRLVANSVKKETTNEIDPLVVDLALKNGLNELDLQAVDSIKERLRLQLQKAVVVHMAFSSEPTDAGLSRIVGWLRKEVSQSVLIHVTIRPSIAGGCIVRTNRRIYDFSFRRLLTVTRPKLVEAMR